MCILCVWGGGVPFAGVENEPAYPPRRPRVTGHED